MSMAVKHLRLRLAAGCALALIGNASAAASPGDRAILDFKPTSPVMRPQTQKKSNANSSTNGGSMVKIPIRLGPPLDTTAPVVNNPIVTQPLVAQPPITQPPAPILAPRTTPNQSTSAFSQPTSQSAPSITNVPTLAPRQPIAEPDSQTTAGFQALSKMPSCPECRAAARNSFHAQADQLKDVRDKIDESTGNEDLKNRLAIAAVREAVATRTVSQICGGGVRAGNHSKCACAGGVKDALKVSGACPIRISTKIDAVNLAGLPHGNTGQLSRTGPNPSTALPAYCPAFHQIKGRFASLKSSLEAAKNAPPGSVIVYSTTRHRYGHIETKIQVTAENYAQISKKLRVKVGQVLYCSDFCNTHPTFSHDTNRVEAIYSL